MSATPEHIESGRTVFLLGVEWGIRYAEKGHNLLDALTVAAEMWNGTPDPEPNKPEWKLRGYCERCGKKCIVNQAGYDLYDAKPYTSLCCNAQIVERAASCGAEAPGDVTALT